MRVEPEERYAIKPEGPSLTAITIKARFVTRVLATAIALLIAMHAAVHVAWFRFGRDHLMGLTPLFDLNRENNVPTWYSGTVFLVTAAALAVVAVAKRQTGDHYRRHWTILALMFAYLSFDELTRIHENWGNLLNEPLAAWRDRAFLGGMFRNLWVVPAGLVAALVGLSYLRFLLHLPRRTRVLFVASGVTFVAAAVGMEMVGASYSAAGGRYAPGFMVLVAIEEGLEMVSMSVFLFAVLDYSAASVGRAQVTFER
jgi:hypothetical protein